MESCLEDFRDQFALPYLDDVLVYSKNFSDHLNHLRRVLRRLRLRGVKLKASKCNLFRKKVHFLGHIVTAEGYQLDPASTQPLQEVLNNTTAKRWRCS